MCPIYGQVKDSIAERFELQIKQAVSDSTRLKLEVSLAEHLFYSDYDASRELSLKTLKALKNKEKSTSYYKHLKVRILHNLANCDIEQNNHSQALEYIQEGTSLLGTFKDSMLLGESFRIRGTLARVRQDSLNAVRYYRKAISIQNHIKDNVGLAKTYIHYSVLITVNGSTLLDSVPYYLKRAKKLDTTFATRINADANLGAYYIWRGEYNKAVSIYKQMIAVHKNQNKIVGLPPIFTSLGAAYAFLKDKEASYTAIDSAIFYAKHLKSKKLLMDQYWSKSNINNAFGDYKEAYKNHILHKKYSDSVNNVEEAKRFTELELNYQFEKEKELAAQQLEDEKNKKKLYLIFFIMAIIAGISILYLVRKNNKQKLDLAEMDVLKADLALVNREKELKQILVETSVRKNVLKQTLDQVKKIIDIKEEGQRQSALKSLSALLLSDKSEDTAASVLETYLDEVSVDFKVLLDINYPSLSPKEKELLCLMKMGLSSTEISKLLSTSNVAVKSSRYRIRKKLQIDSKKDIIQFIENKAT